MENNFEVRRVIMRNQIYSPYGEIFNHSIPVKEVE
jgi:hypothetical protein